MLEKISGYSANTIGIEPSANVAAIARSKGLEVISEFFNEGLAGKIFSDYSAAQLVVGANVLCHIPDLNELARALNVVLDDEGAFIFEDPYLLDIVSKLAYDQIYDEHVFLYSVPAVRDEMIVFKIHEGLKAEITQVQDNWIEIILLDGKKGWIPINTIRPLS